MSPQPNRIGIGLLERSRPLTFCFDGREYSGYQGDTLASALLAAGVRLMGRSFKYHRPRGALTAGAEEPNALVQLRSGARLEPNTRATTTELFAGLEAHSQNRWPSLRLDVGAVASWFGPLIGAGFYYKTFMWPAKAWEKLYEPAIRRAAGLGEASGASDPDGYEKGHLFCDVLVIGAGPAGLAAAQTAARSGARVILCEEDFRLGGRLNAEQLAVEGVAGVAWAASIERELRSLPEVRILPRTTVFGAYDGGDRTREFRTARTFGAVERVADHLPVAPAHQPRQRLWKIIARRSIVATGAIERTLVFGGNDRPGVMLASAVRAYVNRFGVTPGRRIAVFTTTDDGWKTAFDLARVGVTVAGVVEARAAVPPALSARASSLGIPVHLHAQVIGTRGRLGLKSLTVRKRGAQLIELPADTLAVSGGWNPNLALTTHVGNRPRWSATLAAFIPGELPLDIAVAGAAAGHLSLAEALHDGVRSAAEAAADLGFAPAAPATWQSDAEHVGTEPLWLVSDSSGKAFVDLQNDVTVADIRLAAAEGYRQPEHLKRYTTLGMATDQGKTSALNGQAIMAQLSGCDLAGAGMPAHRPPASPVAIAALAGTHRGRNFRPTRYTAGHEWAQERGATFIETGDWLRAQWFAEPAETDWLTTVCREVNNVRTNVGVCDVSTLGKIEIQGPDAAALLDRLYINVFSTLPVGKVRYGIMLREDGFVLDDGTTARLGAQRYVMSTTTANAGRIMQHLQHARQVLWPELDVQLTSVTEQWAQFAVAGPNSRQVLQNLLGERLELGNDAFPYLGCAEFRWRGLTARLFRISFSGELAYEIAVPACRGDALIRALMQAGESLGLRPYGLEALGVMRIEKGHVAGNELNGTTTAGDLGFGRMLSTRKDYIGRVLAGRPALLDSRRAVLVGIRPVDRSLRLYAGAHLVPLGVAATLENDQGYVTSVAYSPSLGHWIGLGLLVQGRDRVGERIRAHDPVRSGTIEVEVVTPVFVDPHGSRVHG